MKKRDKKLKVVYRYEPGPSPEEDKRNLERAFDVLFEAALENGGVILTSDQK